MADAGGRGDTPPPRLSIVIPARNEEASIEAALRSVACQRYPLDLLDCVVVDNASADGTAAAARTFGEAHPELNLQVVTEPTPGVGRAKNTGAAAARGNAIIFLDADSRMEPDLAAAVATCYGAGSPAGSLKIVADSRHPLDRGFFALMEVGKVWFGVRGQMMYCDRELFETLGGFDPSLRLAEDLEFLKRLRSHIRAHHLGTVCHVRAAAIRTSPRRLRTLPFHLGMFPMFARWLLAFLGIGRSREY